MELDSLPAVRRACERLGWKLYEGKTHFAWYGQSVGDTPYPRTLFSEEECTKIDAMTDAERNHYLTHRLAQVDHCIGVPGCDYEIGLFPKAEGGWGLVFDTWYSGGLDKVLGSTDYPDVYNPFPSAYAVAKIELEAERLGYAYETHALETGELEVCVQTGGW